MSRRFPYNHAIWTSCAALAILTPLAMFPSRAWGNGGQGGSANGAGAGQAGAGGVLGANNGAGANGGVGVGASAAGGGGGGGASGAISGGVGGSGGSAGDGSPGASQGQSAPSVASGGGGGGGGGQGGVDGLVVTTANPYTINAPSTGATGGSGGAGGASYDPNGNGGGGGGGGEGGVGFLGVGASAFTNPTVVIGGVGGAGGAGGEANVLPGNGGAGGDGGVGASISASGAFLINQDALEGGAGGRGGNGGAGGGLVNSGGDGGNGGAGGAGFSALTGAAVALTNNGAIEGGAGGAGGVGGSSGGGNGANGVGGAGGPGVIGDDLTIFNNGSIAGGLAADGVTQANAITFTGGSNNLTLSPTSTLSGNIGVTGSVTFNQPSAVTLPNMITGSGSIIQAGPGALTLSGANAYSGGTLIEGPLVVSSDGNLGAASGGLTFNGGVLEITGTSFASSARAITLDAGGGTIQMNQPTAFLTLTQSVTGPGSLTISGGTLALDGANSYTGGTTINSSATLELGDATNQGSISGAVTNNGTFQIDNANTSALTSLTNNANGAVFFANGSTAGAMTIVNDGVVAFNDSSTAGSAAIDTQPNAITEFAYTSTGGLAQLTTEAGGAVDFSASTGPNGDGKLTAGSIAGAGDYFLGSDQLTVGGNNLSTTVSGAIADGNNTGSGAGGASLVKIGSGMLTLSGADTYTGATDVQGGSLLVNGSLASSGVTAENGATLGGSGTIANAVTIANGASLSPGAGGLPSTLTVGSLTLNSGSNVDYQLGAADAVGDPTNDLTNVNGNLVLAGSLDVTDSANFAEGSYRLFNYGGALTNNGLTIDPLPYGLTGVIQTAIPGEVNLVASSGAPAQYWDGATASGDGTIHGGNGTWDATTTNWTSPAGVANSPWQSSFGVFAGAAGTVTVAGQLSYQGLQFLTDGYVLTAANGASLSPIGDALIRVDSGVTATVATPIVGSGGVEKTDPGTLILSGDNTYSGGTVVTNGTLGLGSNAALGSSGLTLNAGTVLQAETNGLNVNNGVTLDGLSTIDTQANNLTLSGAIGDGSSAGGFAKAGSGTLTLTGNNTFSGGVTISNGTLVGSTNSLGSGAIVDNAALVFDQTTNGTFGSVISGSGSLAKQGGGTLTLTGSDPLTGPTNVQTGTLIIDGSLANSAITVENGATLGGSGLIGSLTADAGGVITPTLTVTGGVTFDSGSIYDVTVNPAGQSARLSVDGAATLSGGTIVVTAEPGVYTPASRFTVLTAAGGVTGTFGQLQLSSQGFAFLSPELSYQPDDVILGFAQTTPFASVALSRNQAAAGAALQALGASNPLYDTVVGQTVAGARQAFDAVSGEAYASAAGAAYEDSRLPREAILDRLSAPFDAFSADVTSDRNDADEMTAAYPPSAAASADPDTVSHAPQSVGVWGRAFGDWGVNRSDADAATMARSTGGFMVGEDAQVFGLGGGDWRFGAAEGFTSDDFSVAQRASSGNLQSVFGALYVGARFGAADLRGGAIYGFNSLATERQIAFPGFAQQAQANANGASAQVFGEMGYRFDYSGASLQRMGLREAMLEPTFGAADVNVRQNAFSESGGDAALNGFGQTYNVPTTTLGMRAETTLAGPLPITAAGFLGWRHAYGALTPTALLAFEGATQTFSVSGAPIDRNALEAEAGLSFAPTANTTLGVSYSGQYGAHATDNAVRGEFALTF